MKQAFICGFGMVIDLSGQAMASNPHAERSDWEHIGTDFQQVGGVLQFALDTEGKKILEEAKEADTRQLKFELADV